MGWEHDGTVKHGQVGRPSSPTSAPTRGRFRPGPGSRWQTVGRSYAPDPAAVGTMVSQAVDSQPRSPVRAPTTTDIHPTTTTSMVDARSGSASGWAAAAAVGPHLVSVVPIALCASTPAGEVTHRLSPLTRRYGTRSQASAGLSLNLPSARRSAARDGPERVGTPGDDGSCRRAACARHGRFPGPCGDGTGP